MGALLVPFGAFVLLTVLARVAHGAVSKISMAVITSFLAFCIGLLAGSIGITKATPPVIAGLIFATLMGPSSTG
ncbi:hypothetical protein [Brucella intermedia]|uniref:hypothetical protein n=1 Tax=Brucella intermedia TaxID=94625 RepID=UPI002248D349|nr:hypothetical protein [Brucella intermedia]